MISDPQEIRRAGIVFIFGKAEAKERGSPATRGTVDKSKRKVGGRIDSKRSTTKKQIFFFFKYQL